MAEGGYTVKDLKVMARDGGLKGYSKLRRDELCDLLNLDCTIPAKPKTSTSKSSKSNGKSKKVISKTTLPKNKTRKVPVSKTTKEKLENKGNKTQSEKAKPGPKVVIPKVLKPKVVKPILPTIKEMKQMAKDRKLSNYSNLDKQGLCKILGIDCGVYQKRKLYQYTKSQLIEMGTAKELKGLHKLSIPEICKLLEIECEEIEPVPKKKVNIGNVKDRLRKIAAEKKKKGKKQIKRPKSTASNKKMRNKAKIMTVINSKPKNEERKVEIIKKYKNKLSENKGRVIEEKRKKDEADQKHRENLRLEWEEANRKRLEKSCIERSIKPLRKHQIDAIMMSKGPEKGHIIAHEVGTGKSLTGWASGECFAEDGEDNRVIFVVPKSVIPGFVKTAVFDYGSKFNFYVETGKDKAEYEKYKTINDLSDRVDFNGESLPKIMIIGKDQFTIMFKNKNEEYLKKYFKNVMIIIDEAHNLRGGETKTHFSLVLKCCKNAKKIILLTGTPVYNKLYDYAKLIALAKGEDAIDENEFYSMVNPDTGDIYENKKSREYFACTVSIFKYGSNNVDFPEKRVIVEKVNMSDEVYYTYRTKECAPKKNSKGNLPNAGSMTFLTGLRTGLVEIPPKDNPKYKRIKDILAQQYKEAEKKEKGSGEKRIKSVIFSEFKGKGIDSVSKILNRKNHCNMRKYTGETSSEDRDTMVKDYNNDKFNILLITKAGGEGLDLRGVRNVFILEGPWNDSVIEQVSARAIRFRSHTHLDENQRFVNVYYMSFVKPLKENRDEIFGRLSQKDPIYSTFTDEEKENLRKCEKLEISADEMLFNLSEKKAELKENFMNNLIKFSYESSMCQKMRPKQSSRKTPSRKSPKKSPK